MKRLAAILSILALSCLPSGAQTVFSHASPTVAESSRTLHTGEGGVLNYEVNSGVAAVWVILFDATAATLPASGAITGCALATSARPCVLQWHQLAVNSTLDVKFDQPAGAMHVLTGVTVACSTTGPFTLTLSATCTFSGRDQ